MVFPRWYHLISSSLSSWTNLVFKVCLRSISQPSSLSFSDFFCLADPAWRLALFSLSYNDRSYFLPNPEGIGVNILFYFAIAQARYFPCIPAAKFVSQHYESLFATNGTVPPAPTTSVGVAVDGASMLPSVAKEVAPGLESPPEVLAITGHLYLHRPLEKSPMSWSLLPRGSWPLPVCLLPLRRSPVLTPTLRDNSQ